MEDLVSEKRQEEKLEIKHHQVKSKIRSPELAIVELDEHKWK